MKPRVIRCTIAVNTQSQSFFGNSYQLYVRVFLLSIRVHACVQHTQFLKGIIQI